MLMGESVKEKKMRREKKEKKYNSYGPPLPAKKNLSKKYFAPPCHFYVKVPSWGSYKVLYLFGSFANYF